MAKINRSSRIRIMIVMFLMVGIFALVTICRLCQLMLVEGEKYQTLASEQQLYDTLVSAPRGNIYDAKRELLATSDTAYTIFIKPNGIAAIEKESDRSLVRSTIASGLSEVLSMDYEKIRGYCEKSSSYVTVQKRVDKSVADKVREFISKYEDLDIGKYVGIDETTKRYYPNDKVASVLLGFVGDDNQGLSGLESYYDTTLTGTVGRVVAAKNALGADMPFTYQVVEEAVRGNSLELTIDSYIQYTAEKYLEQALEVNKASNKGACIIQNVNTGAILAMAIKGDFDPNQPFNLSESDKALLESENSGVTENELLNRQWRNKAISDTYEPGSVFKIFTAAMALEENQTSLAHSYNCGYKIFVAGKEYHCHKKAGHGTVSLTQAMVGSCNPAFITIGQLVGKTNFSKYFEAFGFTKPTGIDLPGETGSIYYSESKMGPVELASASFGQSFQVTPIQMITAASAAVNGGYLLKPYVVSEIIDSNGNVVESVKKTVRRQVISNKTSQTICDMMLHVVDDGGAKNGYVPGYKVGGKTGTSEKLSKNLETGEKLYVSSYITFAPMENPEIAILVMIDEPRGASYYGGTVAAPVGAEILSDILPYMGFEPQYTEQELANFAISVPNVTGDEVVTAKNKITVAGLNTKVVGNGTSVVSQLPESDSKLSKGGTVILYTDSESETILTTVPDFNGKSLSEVNKAAASANINLEFAGNFTSNASPYAYKQSVEA
ncbi:MAG: PASTA domain-containing protein, partial [Clostridia bacterium]|nr:PASTA domain-containing protein [Clostridia bacterium]